MKENKSALRFSVPLTHSDWMLREASGVVWGPEGVKYMLDACKACGWTQVHWRTFDGGQSNYKSKYMTPGTRFTYDSFHHPITPEDKETAKKFGLVVDEASTKLFEKVNTLDYSEFDSLKFAVEYGHQIGLEIFAWITINEDDHGWGMRSDFSLKHPEYRWRRRSGVPYRSQISFAFPEAFDYKVALVQELVEGYDIDGLFIDWIRTGDVRDDRQVDDEGVADRGYEEPLIKSFQEKYGIDPLSLSNGDDRWVQHRAEPHTEFMRKVREIANSKPKALSVSVLVYHPWAFRGMHNWIDGNLRGMHLDVKTWANEGLIDEAIAAGYFIREGTPEMAVNALREETEGKIQIGLYAWVPHEPAELEATVALADKVGCEHVLFWEADYIDVVKKKAIMQEAMSAVVS